MKDKEYWDQRSVKIEEFDVLKVFHFTGARKKKYFMYKWVKKYNGNLVTYHLSSNEHGNFCSLDAYEKDSDGRLRHVEIISSNNWKKL